MFSSPRKGDKKASGVDELDESDHGESFIYTDKRGKGKGLMLPPAMAQPPPTFFAGSSPPSPVPEAVPSREKPLEQDVVDLTDLPPTVPVEKPKPKKPRKKKGEVDGGDGDGMDMDFDPNEGKKKKKVKAKAKEEKGKEKTSPGTGQVEVTITVPPPKTKGKGRSKGKEKEKEKEVFKSKEFINDSEDEGVLGGAIPATNILAPPVMGSPPPAIGSPPAASVLVPGSSGSGKKRKSNETDDEEVE